MSIDERTYKQFDTIHRYKKSILLDSFLDVFSCSVFMVMGLAIDYGRFDFVKYIMYVFAALCFVSFFLLDIILKGDSLGKKIMKIKLVNVIKNEPILPQVILYRRYLECSIDTRFIKMNFLEKSEYIDKLTLTKIVNRES